MMNTAPKYLAQLPSALPASLLISTIASGSLENAQAMAAHESPRTTKLCYRTKERLTLDEIERIRL